MEASAFASPEPAGNCGRREAFETFFRAHYTEVVRLAFGVVGDSATAQDVAQDVFIAAERRFADLPDQGHAAAWVRVAAVHTGLNAIRARRRLEHRHMRAGAGLVPASAEELVIERLSRQEVSAAIGRLPKRTAAVLVLRHSGLSYSEVAESMGVSVGHVGSMLRRAEAALRKEVERATRS
ncbi:MAG TPA: sigma-70 family RNA polymerase sigma factor [Acidimicrobiales bacterium]|jgi:RNA polymerase sigma-70 factor (ECF subfamily)|nr:sigma-70 family RNA polymerase sigma factor [Acidimicrobiales bacterium]